MEIKRPAIAGTLVSSGYGVFSIICLISGLNPGCDQIIDIINYIVIPHKVLPLQDLRVLVLQKGIGLDGPVPSLRVLGV